VPESKSKSATPKKSKLEIKPVEDLEPDEARGEEVRGGIAGGPMGLLQGGRFSDVALKNQIAPLRHALAKLRELRF